MKRYCLSIILMFISLISIYYWFSNQIKSNIPPEIVANSRYIEIYQLETNKALTFPLLTPCQEIRIATNAEFSDSVDLRSSSAQEPYDLEVQAFDIDNKLIETKNLKFYTKTQFYFNEKFGMYLASFFLDSNGIASETRVSILNYTDRKNVASLKIKRLDSNVNLRDIYIRVYQPTGVSDSQLEFYWHSLMPKDKERLAMANIYPVDQLQKNEQKNIVKNLWTSVGPRGIPASDFYMRSLYSLTEAVGIPYDVSLLYSGNYVDDSHQLIIPISEDASDLKIEVIPAEIIYPKFMRIWLARDNKVGAILKNMQKPDDQPVESNIDLRWRGRGLGQTLEFHEKFTERSFIKNYKLDAGLITVEAKIPAYVNISKRNANSGLFEDIDLNPSSVNVLELSDKPLIFEIFHSDNVNTDLRLDFRRVSNLIFDENIISEVKYRLLGEDDKIIDQNVLKINPVIVKTDFAVRQGNLFVSDRFRYFLSLNKEVKKIEITGDKTIFVSLFNRGSNSQREYQIPNDYKLAESKEESLRRTWFYKKPLNFNDIIMTKANLKIKTQPRVIEEDELLKAGIYDWQELIPDRNNWSMSDVMVSKNIYLPSRREGESVEFAALPVNQGKSEIELIGSLGEQNVTPTMIYQNALNSDLEILIDGKTYFRAANLDQLGQQLLPNIRTGKHLIEVKASKDLLLSMNYSKSNIEATLKHNLVRFNNEKLTFTYKKEDKNDKIITLKLFTTNKETRHLKVKITPPDLQINKFLNSYTVKERQYEIEFQSNSIDQRFIQGTQSLYASEPIFIKLGADLGLGDCKIEIIADKPKDLYISLFVLTPGLIDKRTISLEVEDE